MYTSKVSLGTYLKEGTPLNSGEAVHLRKLAVFLQGLWLVDWNLLIQDVRWVVPSRSLEGDKHRS